MACHELLHVRQRDSWAVLVEELARTLLWSQPAAWRLLSGISLAREQAIDGAVVRVTGDRRSYIRALARLAAYAREAPSGALPFHSPSHLLRRVAHLAREVPMSRRSLVLATAAAAVLLLLVGAAGAAAVPFGEKPGASAAGPQASKATASTGAAAASATAAKGAAASAAKPPATGDDVLKVGGDVKEPVVVTRVAPVYPEEARKNRVQGRVILEAVVDEKGTVAKVRSLESPDPTLSDAALEAVKKWTYKPATKKGKAVKVLMTVTVTFRLQ